MEIKDNQYKEAPSGPPVFLAPADAPDRDALEAYRHGLMERVCNLDPEIGLTIRKDLIEFDEQQTAVWSLDRIQDQPTDCLRDLIVRVENTEDILKEDPRLL